MYQRKLGRGKSASFSSNQLAQKVYCSNRILEKKKEDRARIKSNHASINHDENKKFFNQMLTKRKNSCHQPKHQAKLNGLLKDSNAINLPVFKKTQSESTAEDFTQKIKKSQSIHEDTRNKIRSYLYAKSRKDKQTLNNTQKEQTTISYENQYSQNMLPRKKILQCKIIKSPAIPFLFPKKYVDKRKFESLQVVTQNISIIHLSHDPHFISPQSQQIIEEF